MRFQWGMSLTLHCVIFMQSDSPVTQQKQHNNSVVWCHTDLCIPVPHMVMWQAPRRLHSSEDTHSTLTPDWWPWAFGRMLMYDCISRQRSSSVLRGLSSYGEAGGSKGQGRLAVKYTATKMIQ